MDIYDADGLLDRAKVLAALDAILPPPGVFITPWLRDRLVTLLDACAEGSDDRWRAVFTGQGCTVGGCGCEAGWVVTRAPREGTAS